MNAKFIFDVDGVLCDRGQLIDEKFKWFLEDWAEDKQYYLATGSPRNKTIAQIGMQRCYHFKWWISLSRQFDMASPRI